MASAPFVFLDRDGTLIEDVHYGYRLEDYRLLPCAIPALKLLAARGYRFVIVTNQSGIGRGYFTRSDFEQFHECLLHDLSAAGIEVVTTYMCPHIPADGCTCRKPSPTSLHRARDEFGADLAASWMIGDHLSDVEAGLAAGCSSILVMTGHGPQERMKLSESKPVEVCIDLLAAAEHILRTAS